MYVDEEMGPEVHDNRLAQAFCKTLFGHLKGDGKDMDMAVFWGGWLKLCGVSCCAVRADSVGVEWRYSWGKFVVLIGFWSNIAA